MVSCRIVNHTKIPDLPDHDQLSEVEPDREGFPFQVPQVIVRLLTAPGVYLIMIIEHSILIVGLLSDAFVFETVSKEHEYSQGTQPHEEILYFN